MPEAPTTTLAVYSARPTVQINLQSYAKVSELLIGMEMVEQEGGLSSLELRFNNIASDSEGGAGLAFEDDRILKLGAAIAVYSGDEMAPQEIFRGMLTGLEAEFSADGAPTLLVLAEDSLQQARMARRTQIYENPSIADLVRQLAQRLSLTPIITGFTDAITTHVQMDESDLAFLRRVLARYDGDLQVVGTELHVLPRGEVRRGSLELHIHSQLRRVRILADLAHQVTQITVSGWNPEQGQPFAVSSTGVHRGPGAGWMGAQILANAVGSRSHHIAHLAATSEAEAHAIADAAFDARAHRFVQVEGTAEGNPALRVGTHVSLLGMGDRFDNTYYATRVCHRFDGTRGYETDFEAEGAFWGGGR